MHYPQTIPGGDWGRRDQLKARRHQKMLEVFSDISYAAGADHKSIQGLVVYYAGVPIAWQCGVQPFVAHSTAEAELIAYCESLVVGRATEALLASIWQQWDFEKVIYGDNAAAINLAHGVTTASWRTRHLRIRASVLKEALDETNRNRGGGWKLLHLKGTELVADGCTKPLQGQAFTQFVDDLGLRRTRREHRPAREERPAAGGEHHGAAMRAMMVGSVLLSTAEAHGEENEEVFDRVWTAGILLVALGVIYAGQLLFQASRCCLRRLRQSPDVTKDRERSHRHRGDHQEMVSEDASEDENAGASSKGRQKRGASSLTSKRPSGSRSGCPTSQSMKSGSATRKDVMEVSKRSTRSGASEVENAGPTSSMFSRGQSGLGDGELDLSLSIRRRSGSSRACAAGEPAADLCGAAAVIESETGALENRSVGSVVGEGSKGGPKGVTSSNPWNHFQHAYKGKGLNSTSISQLYHQRKLEQSGRNST
jgi:hypothetical protein